MRSLDRLVLAAIVAILLTPVWWALGLDQAVWLLTSAALGGGLLVSGRRPVLWGAIVAFVVIAAISGALHATGSRWLTFARDLLIIVGFWLTMLGTAAIVAKPELRRRARSVPVALAGFMLVSSLASVLAFLLHWNWQFDTPIAQFVPGVVSGTGLGSASLVTRSLGEAGYFLGAAFVRPRGLFLFSTSQAVAAAVCVPLFIAAALDRPRLRWLYGTASALSVTAILISTTRGPALALLGAAALLWLARGVQAGALSIRIPLRGLGGIGVAVGVLLLVVGVGVSGLWRPALDLLTTRSYSTRTSLYEATFSTWLKQPIIGWGTERDWTPTPTPSATPSPTPTPTPTPQPSPSGTPNPANEPPLGSHSQYLGVLFKQGIVGTALFGSIVLWLLFGAWGLLRRRTAITDALVVAFIVSLLCGLTEELWLDPATSLIIAIAWGGLIGSIDVLKSPPGAAMAGDRGEASR